MVWSVRSQNRILPVTGQTRRFDETGRERECPDSGQDGDLKMGRPWPEPRFALRGDDGSIGRPFYDVSGYHAVKQASGTL